MLGKCATLLAIVVAGASCRSESPQSTQRPQNAGGLKIAMIAKSSTNPVFLSARTGAEVAAQQLTKKHNIPIEIVWLTDRKSTRLNSSHP